METRTLSLDECIALALERNHTIPANALAFGVPAQHLQIPVPSQTINVPGQSFNLPSQVFPIPEQGLKLMDEDSFAASVNAQWLLWDGGMRRFDLEVLDGVTRLYHGAVMGHQVLLVGENTQVRMIVLGLTAAEKRHQATLDAMTTAVENRDFNTRAYQNGLVETEDVIQAQFLEELMSAQHYEVRYDHVERLSKLNLVVETEVTRQLTEGK